MALEGGASRSKGGAGHIFARFHHSPWAKKKRNTAHIEIGVGGIFFLSVESSGENFYGDSCSEPERIHEYFAFVYIRQFGIAIIELLKDLFLIVRKRCQQVVVMVCDVPHQFFYFFVLAATLSIRTNVTVEQLF